MTLSPEATKAASRADSNIYPEILVSLPTTTVPPCGAKTEDVAPASLLAKSTVIGGEPTLPLTPSVPNTFDLLVILFNCVFIIDTQ